MCINIRKKKNYFILSKNYKVQKLLFRGFRYLTEGHVQVPGRCSLSGPF